MKTYYSSGKALKWFEEDKFEEGCIPNSGGSSVVDLEFKANTLTELIDKILSFYGVTRENCEFNSCDEEGRLDIAIMETDNSEKATKSQLEAWKQGNMRLWYSIYTYTIKKVTEETVKL